MAKLLIHTQNGKDFYSIEHHDDGDTKEPRLGKTTRYDLTDEQAKLSLTTIVEWFLSEQAKQRAVAVRPPWETDENLRLRMLVSLRAKILQTRDQGEADVAKAQYKKISGKDFSL